MPLITVTGYTHARNDGGLHSDQYIPSFDEKFNAKIQELEARGAVIQYDQIRFHPSADCSQHTAYIPYDGHLSVSTEMMSVDELAEKLHVSRSTITDRCRRNKIKHVKAGPRYLIPRSELNRLASLPSF